MENINFNQFSIAMQLVESLLNEQSNILDSYDISEIESTFRAYENAKNDLDSYSAIFSRFKSNECVSHPVNLLEYQKLVECFQLNLTNAFEALHIRYSALRTIRAEMESCVPMLISLIHSVEELKRNYSIKRRVIDGKTNLLNARKFHGQLVVVGSHIDGIFTKIMEIPCCIIMITDELADIRHNVDLSIGTIRNIENELDYAIEIFYEKVNLSHSISLQMDGIYEKLQFLDAMSKMKFKQTLPEIENDLKNIYSSMENLKLLAKIDAKLFDTSNVACPIYVLQKKYAYYCDILSELDDKVAIINKLQSLKVHASNIVDIYRTCSRSVADNSEEIVALTQAVSQEFPFSERLFTEMMDMINICTLLSNDGSPVTEIFGFSDTYENGVENLNYAANGQISEIRKDLELIETLASDLYYQISEVTNASIASDQLSEAIDFTPIYQSARSILFKFEYFYVTLPGRIMLGKHAKEYYFRLEEVRYILKKIEKETTTMGDRAN